MHIKKVERGEITPRGLKITLVDQNGLKRILELAPIAEAQLLTALLCVPPGEVGQQQPRGPLVAEDVRLAESKDGLLVLEAFVTEKAVIHIALPNPLPERLKALLSEDRSQWRDQRLS